MANTNTIFGMHSVTAQGANGMVDPYDSLIRRGISRKKIDKILSNTEFHRLPPDSEDMKSYAWKVLQSVSPYLFGGDENPKPDVHNPVNNGVKIHEIGVNGTKFYARISIEGIGGVYLPSYTYVFKKNAQNPAYIGRSRMLPKLTNAF